MTILDFATLMGIHLLAVVSPGPDFAFIVRNSFLYNRRSAIWTAVGIGLGILVHVSYSVLGVSILMQETPGLFRLVQLLGASYLMVIGFQAWRNPSTVSLNLRQRHLDQSLSVGKAIRMGFLVNVLNPKATLFFLAVFTQLIPPETSSSEKLGVGAAMSVSTFLWFSSLAWILAHPVLKKKMVAFQRIVEKTMGLILMLLALKIAFWID